MYRYTSHCMWMCCTARTAMVGEAIHPSSTDFPQTSTYVCTMLIDTNLYHQYFFTYSVYTIFVLSVICMIVL